MYSNLTEHRKNITVLTLLITIVMTSLLRRLGLLMLFCFEHYSATAEDLHQRERTVGAARGRIIDTNGVVIMGNRTVRTISVIYNQVKDREQITRVLCDELGLGEELVRKRAEKRSSREVIETNVDKELGDQTRSYRLAGVKADEDYKRYYPYDGLTSKVLRFTEGDNQGIIGLEVKYEKYLKGIDGGILTTSDAEDVEIENAAEDRIEPVPGNDLHISLDVNIQKYVEQPACQVLEKRDTKKVSIIVMNPQNGELIAMANMSKFNLNGPFALNQNLRSQSPQGLAVGNQGATGVGEQRLLNQMRRNTCINNIYEFGFTFRIITAAAGPESGVVELTDQFSYSGFRVVEDRKIRYHKVGGHGAETLPQGAMNSCNPVFIDVGQCLGVDGYYKHPIQFGLKGEMGIDLLDEAVTIMHKRENMGLVELATVSFEQSFRTTPVQLITTATFIVNGGSRVTPHSGVETVDADGTSVHKLDYSSGGRASLKETSTTMRYVLEQVVSEGSGKKTKLEGYYIGGKAATSERLPRSPEKYTSPFIGFTPADNPQVMAPITIDEPEGIYYDGTIAAPMVEGLFKNILPYLGIEAIQEETAVHLFNSQLIIPGKRRILIAK